MAERMTKSEHLRRRIVWHLRHVWQFEDGGNSWKSFVALAEELDAPVVSVKREVRRMAKAGRLAYGNAVNRDGMVHGSGYFLAWDWECHKPGREEDPPYEEFAEPEPEPEPPPAKPAWNPAVENVYPVSEAPPATAMLDKPEETP